MPGSLSSGKWEKTPHRAQLDEALALLAEVYPWMLAPIQRCCASAVHVVVAVDVDVDFTNQQGDASPVDVVVDRDGDGDGS